MIIDRSRRKGARGTSIKERTGRHGPRADGPSFCTGVPGTRDEKALAPRAAHHGTRNAEGGRSEKDAEPDPSGFSDPRLREDDF